MTLEEFKRTQWMTEEEYNDYADVLTKEQIKKTINDVLKDYDNKLQERIEKAIKYIEEHRIKPSYMASEDDYDDFLDGVQLSYLVGILEGEE